MPTILRNLPFSDRPSTVEVRGSSHRLLPDQIIVWVSLSPMGLRELGPRTPRFPAILDTGFTDALLIHREHLIHFTGLLPLHLPRTVGSLHAHGRTIPLHLASLWLHRNVPGKRDDFADRPPFLIELHRGIGISEDREGYPRLPLLGSRAFRTAELQVFIDYHRSRLTIRTPRRFWFFG
jgi:hypothetical protein